MKITPQRCSLIRRKFDHPRVCPYSSSSSKANKAVQWLEYYMSNGRFQCLVFWREGMGSMQALHLYLHLLTRAYASGVFNRLWSYPDPSREDLLLCLCTRWRALFCGCLLLLPQIAEGDSLVGFDFCDAYTDNAN